MPFLKRGHPLTRFRLLGQPSRETLLQAAEHLARVGFRPIDTMPDETAAGWVNFDDPTDSEWRTSRPDRLALQFTADNARVEIPPYYAGSASSELTIEGTPGRPEVSGAVTLSHGDLFIGTVQRGPAGANRLRGTARGRRLRTPRGSGGGL